MKLLLAALVVLAFAGAVRGATPWMKTGRAAEESEPVVGYFFLDVGADRVETMKRLLDERADPQSDKYGQHMSFDEVNELIAPPADRLQAVADWLDVELAALGGSFEFTPAGHIARVSTTAAGWSRLVGSSLHEYVSHHNDVRSRTLRLAEPSQLPAGIAEHVSFFGPSEKLPPVPTPIAVPGAAATTMGTKARANDDDGLVTPDFLRKLYNVPSDYKCDQSGPYSVAVASFLNQFINLSDLDKFLKDYQPSLRPANVTLVGPNDESQPGIEATLDIDYLLGLAGCRTVVWSTLGEQPHDPENEPFLKWLYNVGNTTDEDVPKVFSMSYADNLPDVYTPYADRVDAEFMAGGLRGITFVTGSGDGGVSGAQSQPCTKFVSTYPCSSNYVLCAGGSTRSNPEVVASLTGGGFSDFAAAPSWQLSAIAGYKALATAAGNLPSASLFNATGAGFPDVAAQAEGFAVVYRGSVIPVSGTSAATPTVAALVGLLNDVRGKAGKTTVGWLNPLVYTVLAQTPGAFQDILTGDNPGCNTRGFTANTGWDPLTGHGTINFGVWSNVVSNLP